VRAVIDTNVFVSSFFDGNPRKVINMWKAGKVVLCLSGPVLDEYVEVMKRIRLDEGEIKELLDFFAKGTNIVFTSRTKKLRVVRDDPDDDKFIECAVALQAEVIITGDKG